ncbi:MAG: hypothetical protein WA555_02665 [Candidatus Sulfotelmatobacter sp.]
MICIKVSNFSAAGEFVIQVFNLLGLVEARYRQTTIFHRFVGASVTSQSPNGRELSVQEPKPVFGYPVGAAAIFARHRSDQTFTFKSTNGPIECSWAELPAVGRVNFPQQGMAMFWSIGKACKNQQRGIVVSSSSAGRIIYV